MCEVATLNKPQIIQGLLGSSSKLLTIRKDALKMKVIATIFILLLLHNLRDTC